MIGRMRPLPPEPVERVRLASARRCADCAALAGAPALVTSLHVVLLCPNAERNTALLAGLLGPKPSRSRRRTPKQ